MPLFPPNTAYGRLGGAWRTWKSPWIHRSGSWEQPKRVWVYSDGSWRIVWTATTTDALNPVATINGTEVDITWDAPAPPDPEVATSYNVRRSDGSLVGSVAASGGSYLITDSQPLAGTHAYTVRSLIDGVEYSSAVTNTVTLGVIPGSVTATVENEGVDSNVKVEWSAAPGAVSYNVYRTNGAFVGQGNTVFTDTNPVAGVGSYQVEAVVASGQVGGKKSSNSLTLAQAPSSLTAAAPTGGDNVALAWSVSGVGAHDQIQVVRGGSSLAYLARGTTSYTDSNGREGTVESYQVRAVISGNPGPYSNTATSAIPANVPTSVTAVATSTIGQLKLTWGNPAGSRTGYQVQRNDGGWANVGDDTSPSYYTWAVSTGSRSMRVRTTSAGGASAYVTASATPLWDTTPPPQPTITSLKPEASYGRMVLRFTTSSKDNHQYRVQQLMNGFPTMGAWTSVGNNQTVAYVLPDTFQGGQVCGAVLYVRDKNSNSSSGVTADYKLAESPIVHRAKAAGHTRNGSFDSVSSLANQPAQGYYSAGNEYSGLWYYGTNAIYNSMKTEGTHCGPAREATTWNVGIWRENSSHGTASEAPIYLGLHGWGEKPAPYASTGGAVHVVHFCEYVASLGRGGGTYAVFPANIMSGLITSPEYFQGLGVACNGYSNSYVKLFSHTQDPMETGRLAIWHLG